MSGKSFVAGATAAAAVVAGIGFMKGYDFGCAGEALIHSESIAACAGKTAAQGTLGAVEKLEETATSTVPITVIGEVVMKLNGKAVVNVNNTGWSKFVDGNIFGKTDSTLYWNRDGTKPVTVIYNPCFGMTVNGPSQEQSLAVPKEGDKSESAPVSNVVAKVISNSPTEVSVKIEPGPMQVCFIRVPNAADEPGGKVNQTLFTNDVGGILRTNSNTGPIEAIEAAVSADINQIVKVSAAMQACPEKALSDAGVSEKEIKDIVARATMGGLLKQYANDKAKAQLISAAYNDYFTGARPNAITVELGQPLQRAAMYQQKLENTVNGLKGKLVKLEEQNAEYTWEDIATPALVGCGTGSLRAPNS